MPPTPVMQGTARPIIDREVPTGHTLTPLSAVTVYKLYTSLLRPGDHGSWDMGSSEEILGHDKKMSRVFSYEDLTFNQSSRPRLYKTKKIVPLRAALASAVNFAHAASYYVQTNF